MKTKTKKKKKKKKKENSNERKERKKKSKEGKEKKTHGPHISERTRTMADVTGSSQLTASFDTKGGCACVFGYGAWLFTSVQLSFLFLLSSLLLLFSIFVLFSPQLSQQKKCPRSSAQKSKFIGE